MPILSALILIAVGLVLALQGKHFVWLLIGLAGFVLGYRFIGWILPDQGAAQLLIGIVVGLILGWLATRFTKILLNVAAFVLVGSFAMTVCGWLGLAETGVVGFLVFVIGGLIGLALMRWLADWALLLITAVAGAAIAAMGVGQLLPGMASWLPQVVTIGVAILGIVVQRRSPTA